MSKGSLVGLVFVRLACNGQTHTQTLTKEKALNLKEYMHAHYFWLGIIIIIIILIENLNTMKKPVIK